MVVDASVKVCPDCAETVNADARVCRYCGFRFPLSPGQQQTAAVERMRATLGPFERRLYPTIPEWLAQCWYIGLHGLEGAGVKPRLKSGVWMWVLGGWLLIVSLVILWLFLRAALLALAAVSTGVLLTGRWVQRVREERAARAL